MSTKRNRSAPILRIKKATPKAILPSRGSEFAAGLDVSAAYDTVIQAASKGLVKTDLIMAVPDGCYARVAPRSGLALTKFIDTGAGVIDADYRGNVSVLLFNHSTDDFVVKRGDRVAQLILEKIEYPEVQEVDELEETIRGTGGFGSTGVDLPLAKKQHVACNANSKVNEDFDTLFKALDLLVKNKAVGVKDRRLLKQKLLTASERQFKILEKALTAYVDDEDSAKVQEWIDAFLEAT